MHQYREFYGISNLFAENAQIKSPFKSHYTEPPDYRMLYAHVSLL